MLDRSLRTVKDRALQPVAERLSRRVSAGWLTALALAAGLATAGAAAAGWRVGAVLLWWLSRLLDGIDGPVARARGQQRDLGGYLDILGDSVGYAAIPIGIAAAQGRSAVWIACAVLLATFYLNTLSWTYLAAVAEKRASGASATGESTSVHMPTGLVEGTETIVLYTLMLAWPSAAPVWFIAMAALVGATILQRVIWAARHL
ncbi:MAG: CDP-alcohol phosphatidyltransferase family protein [Ilumatobacteraceae bacterium]